MLTHWGLLENVRSMGHAMEATSADVFVSWLPLYHDMGLIGAWLGCCYFGARLYVMSPIAFLVRPATWLWTMHKYRATFSGGPNFAFELCASRIPTRRTSKGSTSRRCASWSTAPSRSRRRRCAASTSASRNTA